MTVAKFVVTPVTVLVNKKANESEKLHWKVPYSSEANIKSNDKISVNGKKSYSIIVAFLEFIACPVPAKTIASKSASPVHAVLPSLNVASFGPEVRIAFPVVITIPFEKGIIPGAFSWK